VATIYYPQMQFIHQDSNSTCWYACLRMMTDFHRNWGMYRGDLLFPEQIPELQARYEQHGYPTPREWRAWAVQVGLEALDISPSFAILQDLLGRRGPIIYSGIYNGQFSGHAVVIAGVRTRGETLLLHDPMEHQGPVARSFTNFMSELPQTCAENAIFAY
jgi:ABC-type bacteriocin/lantibiotic exporter with double-glycine peptidase domain